MKLVRKHIVTSNIAVFILIIVLLYSCRATKNVPEDKQLLTKVSINCADKEINKSELSSIIRQQPNRKTLFMFKFHLGVYNLFKHDPQTRKVKRLSEEWKNLPTENKRKLSKSWKNLPKRDKENEKNKRKYVFIDKVRFNNKIANVVGEPPVIYESFESQKSITNLQFYLKSQSYYDVTADYTEKINIEKKRAEVTYNIYPGNSYKISEINYDIDSSIQNIIFADTINSLVKSGNKLNTDVLQKERERITKLLKTKGYYYFSISNIHYFADSTLSPYNIQLTISIGKNFEAETSETVDSSLNLVPQTIKNVNIYPDYNSKLYLENKEDYEKHLDTIVKDGYNIIYYDKLKIKPSTLLQLCYINKGDLYNIKIAEQTHQQLSNLKIFKIINLNFEPTNLDTTTNSSPQKNLDTHIYLTPLLRQSYLLEGEVYSTSGNWGLSGAITYNNRNLFKGAQNLYVKGMLSFQTLKTTIEEENHFLFNTFETGIEARLKIPRMVIPFWDNYNFTREHSPNTQFGLSFNYQKRPEYTRTIGIASFGYIWKSGKNHYFTHSFNPSEIYYVKIFNFDESFKQSIANTFLKYSYDDQLLTVISYDLMFSNQNFNKHGNFSVLYANIETSGNIPCLVYKAAKIPKQDGSYKFFGIEVSQFAKFDLDYAFHQILNSKHQLVYRTFLGLGIPYGNSRGLPFIKKYFIGGANDVRAWTIRNLGPGAYSNPESRIEQIGDMKFVANFEYRFNIFTLPNKSTINGALFLDSGNIWSIIKQDDRTDAKFQFSNFYKQIALGTGLGLRYDMSFFVIRLDLGIPLYNPDTTKAWQIKSLKFKELVWNFGINYPF